MSKVQNLFSTILILIVTALIPHNLPTVSASTASKPKRAEENILAKTIPMRAPTILEVRVSAASDDAEEKLTTGAVVTNSSDLELINDSGTDQVVGMRFTGIAIPQGANIISAYVQFTADESWSVATSLTIKGQAIDDAPTFSTGNQDI